jgi:putative colanic acid biosynthesis acetyltransferase WcaF
LASIGYSGARLNDDWLNILSTMIDFTVYQQASAYASPWTKKQRIQMILWDYCWTIFCSWTPKPLNGWRLFWLKVFGAHIQGTPFIHQRARIQIPWNLILHDRACLGDRASAYSLGIIEIKARATVAQEAYLCTGTHDFSDPNIPLMTGSIVIEEDVFVGARAFILPGVTLHQGSVIGACSVVTKDVDPWIFVAGNPARFLKKRERVLIQQGAPDLTQRSNPSIEDPSGHDDLSYEPSCAD